MERDIREQVPSLRDRERTDFDKGLDVEENSSGGAAGAGACEGEAMFCFELILGGTGSFPFPWTGSSSISRPH
jgi:hypothetical protein